MGTSHGYWATNVKEHGTSGVIAATLVVAMVSFLAAWLLFSACAYQYHYLAARQLERQREIEKKSAIRTTLNGLSDWQRRFLLRFIDEERTQIPEFEVGLYKAAWDFEIEVLIEKKIIKEHRRAGVYEINPVYRDYLEQNLDRERGILL